MKATETQKEVSHVPALASEKSSQRSPKDPVQNAPLRKFAWVGDVLLGSLIFLSLLVARMIFGILGMNFVSLTFLCLIFVGMSRMDLRCLHSAGRSRSQNRALRSAVECRSQNRALRESSVMHRVGELL